MVTEPTGNPRGRPPKPKPPPQAAHRPKLSIRDDPDGFYVAAYRASRDTELPPCWFAAIQCGNEIDPAKSPRARDHRAREGYKLFATGPNQKNTMSDTNPRPGAWARPFTIAGRDRTFRKKERAVYESGDVNDIQWLSNITGAFLIVFLFATKGPEIHTSRAHIDAVMWVAMNRVELAGEPPDSNLIKRGKDLIAGMISHIASSVKSPPD
jgi:hypothetical protein